MPPSINPEVQDDQLDLDRFSQHNKGSNGHFRDRRIRERDCDDDRCGKASVEQVNGGTRELVQLVRLLIRRHRLMLFLWPAGLLLLLSIAVPSYQATYGDDIANAPAIAQMRSNTGMELLYGQFPERVSVGAMSSWEIGFYLTVLSAVMSVLAAAAMTRGLEESGMVELLRSLGVSPRQPLTAAMIVLTGLNVVVGGGGALVLLGQSAQYTALPAFDGVLLGAVVFCSAQFMAMFTAVVAQLRGTFGGVRGVGLLTIAGAYLVRVVADQLDWPWLGWLTPLGWRDLVSPYDSPQAWPLMILFAATVVFAVLAWRLAVRDVGSAWWDRQSGSRRRLRVRGVYSWAWLEARSALIGWSITIALVATLFGAMTRSLVDTVKSDPNTASMMAQMGFDPTHAVATFYAFLGVMVALLIMIAAVAFVHRWRTSEHTGWITHELATGVRRSHSLGSRIVVALTFAAIGALGAGSILGAIGAAQMDDLTMLSYGISALLGQIPAILCAVGISALLTAIAPRFAALAWVPVIASAFMYFLGGLLSLPSALLDMGLFAYPAVPEVSGWPNWAEWLWGMPLIFVVLGVVGITGGLLMVGHRDIVAE